MGVHVAQDHSETGRTAVRARPGDADWPGVIRDLTEAAVEGGRALAEAVVSAAVRLTGGEGSVVLRWSEGRAEVVASVGQVPARFERRLPEGPSCIGVPAAVVSVDPRTDLIVTGGKPADPGDMATLRALGELMSWASSRHTTDLALLGGLAVRVAASLDLEEVLVSVADAGSRLARAEIAGVFLLGPDADEVEMRSVVGNRTVETAHLRIRRGRGLAGRVLATGRPQRVEDYTTDPRMDREFLALADAEGTCSALAVPLVRGADRVTTGALVAWRRRRAPFTDEDEHILSALAELAAAAVHNAEAHAGLAAEAAQQRSARISLEERFRAAERDLGVYTELTRIATEGEDLGAVMRSAGSLTGGSAAMVGEDGKVLADWERPGLEDLPARLEEWAAHPPPAAEDGTWELSPEDSRRRWWMLVVPVRAVGLGFGHLGLGLPGMPSPGDRLAAGQAAVVAGLLLAREEATVAARRRLASDFVWDLLDGRMADSVDVMVRARHLGPGFALPARVAAVEVSGLTKRAAAGHWSPEELERGRARIGRLVGDTLAEAGLRGAVLAHRADTFAVIVPRQSGEAAPDPRRLAATLAGVAWPDGLGGAVGVGGSVSEVGGFPEGWQQACLALSAARRPSAPGVFEDLGVLRFLLAPARRAELDGFVESRLGVILAYDAANGTELVPTLGIYLAEGCSTRKAAERLFVHHRTVSYRLGRIEELAGLRLDDPEDRFCAHLALKILALDHGPPVGTKASK